MRWTDLEDDSVILDTFVPWVHFEPQDAQWVFEWLVLVALRSQMSRVPVEVVEAGNTVQT